MLLYRNDVFDTIQTLQFESDQASRWMQTSSFAVPKMPWWWTQGNQAERWRWRDGIPTICGWNSMFVGNEHYLVGGFKHEFYVP